MQIDPKNITNFSRTDSELQAFWLFVAFCAGKNSDHASRCLSRLLRNCKTTPFEHLRELGEIGTHNALVASRIGQYARLTRFIMESLDLNLRTATVEDLMKVFGIGFKTARFFLLHTRPNCECAVLDCHVLKYLKDCGVEYVPSQTPTSKNQYHYFEKQFLFLAKRDFPFMSIADIDLLIWTKYSGRLENDVVEPSLPFEP
jgi:thermostable 8-oxoguanine DNA glycosylase